MKYGVVFSPNEDDEEIDIQWFKTIEEAKSFAGGETESLFIIKRLFTVKRKVEFTDE